jgi:hypothetical protein
MKGHLTQAFTEPPILLRSQCCTLDVHLAGTRYVRPEGWSRGDGRRPDFSGRPDGRVYTQASRVWRQAVHAHGRTMKLEVTPCISALPV